jgi:ABC-2 type transport system permease protein
MKHILDITFKDLLEMIRNPLTFAFFLIMPIAFTLLFGFAFSGVGKAPEDPRLPAGFINQDGSPLSQELTTLLKGSTVFRLVVDSQATPADFEKQVVEKDLAAAIFIPAGYGDAALSGAPAKLAILVDASSLSGMTIQNDALTAVSRLMNAVRTAQIVSDVSGDPSIFDSAVTETLAAWKDPPIRVADKTSASTGTQSSSSAGAFSHTSPAMMLQFAIAGLLTAAQVLVSERKSRCLQRLLTTAVSRGQILIGHYFAIVLLLLAQFLLLILFGQLFLKLDYLRQAGATLLVTLTTALCIGGLGLLIGVLAKSDEQAIMFSLIPMFILSALGGAWVPLEVTGPTFSTIGHVSPVAWALDGFENIVSRDLGFSSVLIPAAALVGYAVLFFLLASWRFRRVSE